MPAAIARFVACALLTVSDVPWRNALSQAPAKTYIATILASGEVIVIDAATGQAMLSTTSLGNSIPQVGRYLKHDPRNKRLVVLVPGLASSKARLVEISLPSFATRNLASLPTDAGYTSLDLGERTGSTYVFAAAGKVLRVSPSGDSITLIQTRDSAGPHQEVYVYRGAVALNERRIFQSFHGGRSGLFWYDHDSRGGMHRCPSVAKEAPRCAPSHGSFETVGTDILVATGMRELWRVNSQGEVIGRYDTGLEGNHLMEFAVNRARTSIAAVGSCRYTGGLSVLSMRARGTAKQRTGPRDLMDARIVFVAPSHVSAPGGFSPEPPRASICGERIAYSNDDRWIAVARPILMPFRISNVAVSGEILLLDAMSGEVVRKFQVASEPMDVIVFQ